MVKLNIDLPDGFLDEEVRCGYTVTREMKEIWAVELDLLSEFMRVCKKYNIQFYADGGTALGCVRHNGFIPWDDDIDVSVSRSDYEKLCKVSHEFKYPYFFQTEQTDPGSCRGHIQIRNSETTAIIEGEAIYRCGFNQGIFIDIFAKDNIPDDDELESYMKEAISSRNRLNKYRGILLAPKVRFNQISKSKKLKNVIKLLCFPFVKMLKLYDKEYTNYESIMTRYRDIQKNRVCCIPVSRSDNYKRFISSVSFFYKNPINVKFEFLELPVPADYDDILRTLYGDYMKYVIGNSLHGNVIFDVNISYKEYLKK